MPEVYVISTSQMMSLTKKTALDFYVADTVKALRLKHKMTQADLGFALGVTATFIGHIENPNHRAKYNISHLNKLAKIFSCSPRLFLPEQYLQS